jgi:hypothetical protein
MNLADLTSKVAVECDDPGKRQRPDSSLLFYAFSSREPVPKLRSKTL